MRAKGEAWNAMVRVDSPTGGVTHVRYVRSPECIRDSDNASVFHLTSMLRHRLIPSRHQLSAARGQLAH